MCSFKMGKSLSKWCETTHHSSTAANVFSLVPSRPGTRLTRPRTFRKWREELSQARHKSARTVFPRRSFISGRHVKIVSFLLKFSSKKSPKFRSQYIMLSVTLNTTRSVFLVKFLRCFQYGGPQGTCCKLKRLLQIYKSCCNFIKVAAIL